MRELHDFFPGHAPVRRFNEHPPRQPPFTSWARVVVDDISSINANFVHSEMLPTARLQFIMNERAAPASDTPFHVKRLNERPMRKLPPFCSEHERRRPESVPSFEPSFEHGSILHPRASRRHESLSEHFRTMTAPNEPSDSLCLEPHGPEPHGIEPHGLERSMSLPAVPVRRCVSPPTSASGVIAFPPSRTREQDLVDLRPVRSPAPPKYARVPVPVVPRNGWCVSQAWGKRCHGHTGLARPSSNPRLGPFADGRMQAGLAANINRNRRFS